MQDNFRLEAWFIIRQYTISNNILNMTFNIEVNQPEHLRRSPDFQTEHMHHKIRAIHKKKKRNNYKCIETLENINDTLDGGAKPNTVIEGLAVLPIATFEESDWTQSDNIYEGGKPTTTKKFSLSDLVNYVFDTIDRGFSKIAEGVVYASTLPGIARNNTDAEKDTQIVKNYVIWFFAIILAEVAVYNWAFLMIYKDHGERIELYDISRKRLHDAGITNTIYSLLDFLLDIPLFFPEKLQEYFVKIIPDTITTYVNPYAFFSLLFLFLVRTFHSSGAAIRKMVLDIVNVNMSNPILSIMYATTFLLYVLSFFEFKPISTALSLVSLVAGFPASLIKPFVSNIIKVFFLMMFSVPVATVLCFFYTVGMSFFGMRLLSTDGFFNVSATIEKVKSYLESHRIPIKKDTICEPLTLVEKVLNILYSLINFVSTNIFTIGYITMFTSGIIEYLTRINHPGLKIVLIIVNIMAITTLGISAYMYYLPYEPVEEEVPETTGSKQEDMNITDSLNEDFKNVAAYATNLMPDISKLKEFLPTLGQMKENIPTTLGQMKENLPTLGQLKEDLPTLGQMKEDLPTLGQLKENLPTLGQMKENLPTLGQLKENLPTLGQLKEDLPTLGQIKENLPTLGQLKEDLPTLGQIKENLPTLGQLKDNLHTLGQLKANIPDVSQITSSISPNTDIAQQINTALKDDKS